MYFATIEKGHVHLEGCMHMGKIQEYRERLQQGAPDNEIIKYIGKIDGQYFYLVTYTEFVVVGYPQIIEIDSKNPDMATTHYDFDFVSSSMSASHELLDQVDQAKNLASQHHYQAHI